MNVNPTMNNSTLDDDPSLTIDLAEPILALAVHLAAVASLWQPTAIAQPLNVLPFSVAPLVTKTALIQLPHVDLDIASEVGNIDLLRFMLRWSKQPGGRPVHYDGDVYPMVKQGNLDVLNWWVRESGLVLEWNDDYGGFAATFEHGHVHVLEWWREFGFPHLDEVDLDWCFSKVSSGNNGVRVLDWCAQYLPANVFMAAAQHVAATGSGFFTHAGGDPYLVACRMGRVDVLDWLYLNEYLMRDSASSLGAYFDAASEHDSVLVLEWFDSHVDSSDVDYFDVAFMCALTTASGAGSIAALNWWWKKLADIGALEALASSEYADDGDTIDVSGMLRPACDEGAIDIVRWWMQKNQADPLKDRLDFGDAYLHACFERGDLPQPNCVAILREFLNAGVEMDLSSCIYLASTNGKLDVLDWLLKEAKAPVEAFLDAFNPADDSKYYYLLSDCNTHQRTHAGSALLWWRYHVPHVDGVTLTKSPANELFNPIKVHLLDAVLKVQGIPRPCMRNVRGRWAMLYYLQDRGILTEAGLEEDEDEDWSLEEELIHISAKGTPSGLCAALEWWQASFPVQFACPAAIASGNTPVWRVAKKWWLRSELCGADSKISSFD